MPSWRGKTALEFSAFRLGTSPVVEMDDHKTYYDPRDLWPLLVRAGFRPHAIRCFKHKFGLNTFAVCRTSPEGNTLVSFTQSFLAETAEIVAALDTDQVERIATGLARVRDEQEGRLFILGVGGSAGHASHAVNDFRKICGFEAYAPTDNVSELTARTNDEGWDTTFSEWLEGSRLDADDALLVFSVGGGDAKKNVSANLVRALELARSVGAAVFGIVGRDGGTRPSSPRRASIVPPLYPDRITPHTEGLCAVRVAPARHPPGAGEAPRPSGSRLTLRQLGRVLIVGGAGFIGSHFVRRLLAGDDVERGHALRQLLLGARVALRADRATILASRSCAATSRTSPDLVAAARASTWSSTSRRTPTSRRGHATPPSTSTRAPC